MSHIFAESDSASMESSMDGDNDDKCSEFEFDYSSDDDEEDLDLSGSISSESNRLAIESDDEGYLDSSTLDISDESSLGLPNQDTHLSLSAHDDLMDVDTLESNPLEPYGGLQHDSLIIDTANVHLASIELDYALISLTTDETIYSMFELLPILSPETVAQIPRGETKIKTVTGTRGRLAGVISGVPSYIRLGYSKIFQECFTVTIGGPLSPGDSGSTIIDSRTGQIYGHIMVGSVISRTA